MVLMKMMQVVTLINERGWRTINIDPRKGIGFYIKMMELVVWKRI